MSKRKILIAGTIGVFTLGAASSAALAEDRSEKAEIGETAAALSATHSLSDAIRAAEAKTGGEAFSASLEDDYDAVIYEVDTAADDTVTEVKVSAASGEVLETETDGFVAKAMRDDEDIAALGEAKIGLLEAVAAAEAEIGGAAMEAELDDPDGSTAAVYRVEVARAGDMAATVYVDGASGAVLKSAPGSGGDDDE